VSGTSFPVGAIYLDDKGLVGKPDSGTGQASRIAFLETLRVALLECPTTEPVPIGQPWLNSGVLTLSVGIPPSIIDQPDSLNVDEGNTATFTIAANDATSYQWQRFISGVWTDLSGATATTYTTPAVTFTGFNGAQYRCVVTGPGGVTNSATATITVPTVSPTFSLQPSDATVPSGSTVTFTVAASGGNLTYQWQRDTGNGYWSNIAGANSPTFTTPVLTASERKHAWRCRVHNNRGRIMSRIATVAIRATALTYYVDNVSGNNANPGTEAQPFQTITQAISMGTSVNILLRRGQTFSGSVTLNSQAIGAYGTGAAPILDHNLNSTLTTTGNALIEDIEVRNSHAASLLAATVVAGNTRVRRCTLRSNGNKCITMQGTDNILENCVLFDDMNCAQLCTFFQAVNGIARANSLTRTQPQTQIGFFLHGAGSAGHALYNNDINSTVTDTSAAVTQPFAINQDFTLTTPFTIRNNTIRGIGWDRVIEDRRGSTFECNIIDIRGSMTNNVPIVADRGATLTARNNTVVSDGATIQTMAANNTSAASTLISNNNIIFHTTGSNFYTAIAGASVFTANRNLYFGLSRSTAWNSLNWANWQASGRDVNGLNANPLLMDIATGDYRIQSASPARNAGQDLDFELDHFGWEYHPTTPSMGALEYWEAA
jgi:hypothetical protein